MKKTLSLLAACAVLGAMPLASMAQTSAYDGLYIGGSAGQSRWRGDDAPGLDRKDTAFKLYGGYDFTPYFAVELGYADLGEFNSSTGSVKAAGPYLDAVGKLRFNPQWTGLARVGVFNGDVDVSSPLGSGSDRGNGLKVGLGAQYDITKNLGVRGEWERYRLDALDQKPDVDLYSVGLNLKF